MALSRRLREILKQAGVSESTYQRVREGLTREVETDGNKAVQVDHENIPFDVEDVICGEDVTWEEGLELWFEIYADIPCYGVLAMVRFWALRAPDEIQRSVWERYIGYLCAEDDRHADPIGYTLWCDYFEDPETVDEAWAMLVTEDAAPRLLQRVLEVSGPVPYALKAPLYDRLIDDPSFHESIHQSLVGSQFDIFGKIDQNAASEVLARLDVPPDVHGWRELRRYLLGKID